ncbi:uncharacterized protein LOC135925996 [Gordionus sp. m RMFG-2023]|uniref:uncharacterized protein LOC135925996 n=1 Tax=Gordionus sp. m RMFG-2023 TaxID=3053472 RepID=UPI0031FBF0C7
MKVPNVIICRLDQKNFICEREKGYTTKTTSELEMIIKDYLNDTVDHYLITPDLVIGIRSGNETLTINIEQGEEPRVKNITGIMFNSNYLDGFVIITLGKTEIFRGPVSWYIAMISSKDAQPCLIQHNAMETNKTVINEDSNYQNESIIICKRSKPYNSNNNTCKTENGAIIITSGNIATVKEHFKNTNILIQDQNLLIGIKSRNPSVFNIEQKYRLTVKESTKPGRSNGTIYTKELRNVNGSLTISIGNKTFREQILEFLHISSNDKEAKYLVQQNGVDMNDLIRDIIICKRDSVNITCKTENDTITVIEENIWNTFNEYLNYLEYYIKSSNLWIGIRLVKGNLTLNLVQDLKLNVSERIFDYTEEGGSIEIDKGWISVNGTLILTFDNKTISEHVTGNLTIKSLKETQKNYVLQHNGVDVNKLQEE